MPVTTKPLTAAERRWIKEVNALLKKCPSDRLQGFTIGDHDVVVFDGSRMPEIDEYMQKAAIKRFLYGVRGPGLAPRKVWLSIPRSLHGRLTPSYPHRKVSDGDSNKDHPLVVITVTLILLAVCMVPMALYAKATSEAAVLIRDWGARITSLTNESLQASLNAGTARLE